MGKLLEKTNKVCNEISEKMADLASLAYDYIQYYDNYQYENLIDATLLKEKMKENIMKVYNDDIR